MSIQFDEPRTIKYTVQIKWIRLFWKDQGKAEQFY